MAEIKSNIIGDTLKMIKEISSTLFKGLDKLIELGLSVEDSEQTDEGGFNLKVTTKNNKTIFIKAAPTNKKDYYDIEFIDENKKKELQKNIHVSKFDEVVAKVIKDVYGEDIKNKSSEDVSSAHKINATLSKTISNEGTNINLHAIKASYDIVSAYDDLSNVLNSDEFIDILSEEPTSYEIIDDGDDFDINQIESFEISLPYEDLLAMLQSIENTSLYLLWNIHGDNYLNARAIIEEFVWNIRYKKDELANIIYCAQNCVPAISNLELKIIDVDSCDTDSCLNWLSTLITDLITYIECIYCNLPSNDQTIMDQWINDFRNFLFNRIGRLD